MKSPETSEDIVPAALAVAIVAIAARLALFVAAEPWTDVYLNDFLQLDALGYHELAISILNGDFMLSGAPDAFRTPLYPGFLAVFYFFGGNHPWIAILGQITLDGGTCYLICVLFHRRLPAYLYALHPITIFQANVLMSETVLVFVLVLALFALIRRRFFLGGIALGLGALVKPAVLYLPFVLLIWIVFVYRRRWVRPSALLVFAFALTISPWLVRNYTTFDHLSLSSSGRFNMLDLQASRVVANTKSISTKDALNELHKEARQLAIDAGADLSNPFILGDFQKKLALDIFREDPEMFVRTYVLGTARMFANLNTRGVARMFGIQTEKLTITKHESPSDYVSEIIKKRGPAHFAIGGATAIYLFVFYALVIGGFVAWSKNRDSNGWMCLVAAVYFVVLPGPGGVARYLMPAMVFFLFFVPNRRPGWWRMTRPNPLQ